MHVTKLCFMMRELKRNLLSHITEEYFPSLQMACQYVLSCFSKKWEWFFHQPSTLILLFKKKKVLAIQYVTTTHRGTRIVQMYHSSIQNTIWGGLAIFGWRKDSQVCFWSRKADTLALSQLYIQLSYTTHCCKWQLLGSWNQFPLAGSE